MADDRIDDAIAAVARAVARIEAVSHGVLEPPLPDLPPLREPRTPPPPSFTDLPSGFAARPTTALGRGFDPDPEPEFEPEPEFDPEPLQATVPLNQPELAPEPGLEAGPAPESEPRPKSKSKSKSKAKSKSAKPAPEHEPGADIHELVGRIIARTQLLEEHLDAARQLRCEITELVSRLAATAERDR